MDFKCTQVLHIYFYVMHKWICPCLYKNPPDYFTFSATACFAAIIPKV